MIILQIASTTEVAGIGIIWMGPSIAMHQIDTINDPKGTKLSIYQACEEILQYHSCA
jgi:hypothetical protein